VAAYSFDFFKHILPFLVANELATMVGTWGISGYKSKASYLSFFPVNLRALWTVLRKEKIKFPVTPKDRQEGNFLHVVTPQLSVIVLTVAALAFAGLMLALGSPRYTLGGLIANGFWGLNNILAMSGIVGAALWRPDDAAEGELAAA
jgi:cellulose synthase (UDP-forming)